MKLLLVLSCCLLTSCAFYSIDTTLPSGAKVEGTAIVANNSKDVVLNVEHGDFKASFGKTETDGTTIIDALRRALITGAPSE